MSVSMQRSDGSSDAPQPPKDKRALTAQANIRPYAAQSFIFDCV